MKKVKFISFLMMFVCFISLGSSWAAEPEMDTYTNYPIFTVSPVTPNIMIMLDNSGSMNFNAYGSWPGNGQTVADMPYSGGPIESVIGQRIAHSTDDAEERLDTNYTWTNSPDLDIGHEPDSLHQDTYVGLRFQGVAIPKGAEITNAYIEFTAENDHPGVDGLVIRVYGEDARDAAGFTAGQDGITSRAKTHKYVTWNMDPWTANDTYQTPDIKDIIKKIIDREDWESGNDLALLLVPQTTNNNYRRAKSYNNDPNAAPLLHIEFIKTTKTEYYGYFNPEWFYTYGSNKFNPAYKKESYDTTNSRWNVTDTAGNNTTLTDADIKTKKLWDGNFMNWLAMRRIDVLRKVMMGGKATSRTGGGNQVNLGEIPDQSNRYYIRHFNNNTSPLVTPYEGDYYYGVGGGYVYIDNDSYPWSGYNERLYIKIQKDSTIEPEDFFEGNLAGVLQEIGDDAYWGNSFFNKDGTGNNKEGGSIASAVGGKLTDMITDLQNTGCSTWTPLAESYYIVSQYFKQEKPEGGLGYPNGAVGALNNVRDPYYQDGEFVHCAKSFVILLTDGASTMDSKIPAALKDFDGDGTDNTACNESSNSNCDYPSGGTDYLDDVALYARTTDLRSDLEGDQNLVL
ncbi:hypothetical protein KAR91_79315, partial [Candidatus Pacearchaeota archaeon]|nr:hypothetical protein [Candidatus Pacearchaeota archaeon]